MLTRATAIVSTMAIPFLAPAAVAHPKGLRCEVSRGGECRSEDPMQDQRIERIFPAAAADHARHRRRGERHDL
jgi:hypothetical protein